MQNKKDEEAQNLLGKYTVGYGSTLLEDSTMIEEEKVPDSSAADVSNTSQMYVNLRQLRRS
jgi:hypothetical protein